MMLHSTKLLGAAIVIALSASVSSAAYTVSTGTIKSVDAARKSFVMTDSANKDFSFKIGDNLVINRAGKEGNGDLKTGDTVYICYEKGTFTWTAHYVLVQEGPTKSCVLIRGSVKGYDNTKKVLTFTDESKKDSTYPVNDVNVRINMKESKIDDVKIGDEALLLVDLADNKTNLRDIMIDRAK